MSEKAQPIPSINGLVVSRKMYVLVSISLVLLCIAVNTVKAGQEEAEFVKTELRTSQKELDKLSEVNANLEATIKGLKEQVAEKDELKHKNDELLDIIEQRYSTYHSIKNNASEAPILSLSGFTPSMFEKAWEKLNYSTMTGTGQMFVNVEKKTGVNAVFLAALALHESGGGTSRIYKDKNNLYGFGAYDGTPYQSAYTFDTPEEGTLYVADFMRREYLSRDGRWYSGETLKDVGKRYATCEDWSELVASHMRDIVDSAISKGEAEILKNIKEEKSC